MAKRFAMRLKFTVMACDRCGGERLAKALCPECGARPAVHEVQLDLDRRRKAVDEFRQRRRPVEPRQFPADLGAQTEAALSRALTALASTARVERSAERLLDAFQIVDQMLVDSSLPLPRPRLNWGRKMHRALGEAVQALEVFLDALVAPTIGDAQRLESVGNAHLQTAVETLAESRSEQLSRASEEEGISQTLGFAHAALGGSSGLLAPQETVGGALGIPGSDPGLYFSIEALDVAVASMDEERVHHLSDVAARALSSAPAILSDQKCREDLLAAAVLMDLRVHQLLTAISEEEGELAVLENALALGAVVRERGYRACIRALLAAKGIAPLSETHKWQTGRVLKHGEDHLPVLGLDRIDRMLRDAAGHQDFSLDGDTVVLERGEVRLDVDDFSDQLLATIEVFIGMFRGALVAMSGAGIDLPDRVELPPRHQQEVLRYWLGRLGCANVKLERVDNTLHLTAEGTLEAVAFVPIAGAVSTIAPLEIETLTMKLKAGSDVVPSTVELAPFRAYDPERGDGSSHAGILAFLELCAVTTVDDENVLPASTWNDAAAYLGRDGGKDDALANRVRRVLRVRTLARRAGVETEWISKYLTFLRVHG